MKKDLRILLIAVLVFAVFPMITPLASSKIRLNPTEYIAASTTYLNVVNPLTGDGWFIFNTSQKAVGDTFIINITVTNVVHLATWQFCLTWNPSVLTYNNSTIPPDNIFAPNSILFITDTSTPGQITAGAGLLDPTKTVSGNGTLAQVTLKITQNPGQCPLNFAGLLTDTFLLDQNGYDISFIPVNGTYRYNITPASTAVYFNLNPNPVTVGNTLVLKGVLLDSISQPVKSQTVKLYARPLAGGWTYITSLTTNSYGIFTWQVTIPNVSKGTYIFAAYYAGSTSYQSTYNFAILIIQ